jgi:hypothetical protein
LYLCLIKHALCHKGVWRSGCIDPCSPDLGTGWRLLVSFIPWLLYSWEKSPVPNKQDVGWAQEQVWTTCGRENYFTYRDSNSDPLIVEPVTNLYTACVTLPLFLCYRSYLHFLRTCPTYFRSFIRNCSWQEERVNVKIEMRLFHLLIRGLKKECC